MKKLFEKITMLGIFIILIFTATIIFITFTIDIKTINVESIETITGYNCSEIWCEVHTLDPTILIFLSWLMPFIIIISIYLYYKNNRIDDK